MGEMLRDALFGMTGWWVALALLICLVWSIVRRDYGRWLAEQEMSAALAFAASMKNPPKAMIFLNLYANDAANLAWMFPGWPIFFDNYLAEVAQ